MRLSLIKLYIEAADTAGRSAAIQPQLDPIQAKMKEAQLVQNKPLVLESYNELSAVYRANGVKLKRMFYPMLLQAPLGYGTFRLMRGMGELPVPGLDGAGYLWFTDLTIPDPYYIFPAVTSAILWYTIKVSLWQIRTNPVVLTDFSVVVRWARP